ncbi:MAG: hypothetical protein ACHQZR_03780 [Candidatus Limnocylindrales bacterium]
MRLAPQIAQAGIAVDATPLRLALAGPLRLEWVPKLFGLETAPWLGERAPDIRPGARSYRCDLDLQIGGDDHLILRESVLVTLSAVSPVDPGWDVWIDWHAVEPDPRFPVFAGRLRLRPGRLELGGYFSPAGGRVDDRRDMTGLDTVVRATGRWFLRTVSAVL